jgi:hypothetical protein
VVAIEWAEESVKKSGDNLDWIREGEDYIVLYVQPEDKVGVGAGGSMDAAAAVVVVDNEYFHHGSGSERQAVRKGREVCQQKSQIANRENWKILSNAQFTKKEREIILEQDIH